MIYLITYLKIIEIKYEPRISWLNLRSFFRTYDLFNHKKLKFYLSSVIVVLGNIAIFCKNFKIYKLIRGILCF